VFADLLMGRDSADRTLLRVKTRERFKVKMRVALRGVSLVFSLLCRKNLLSGEERRETKQNKTERKEDKRAHSRCQPS